jgi:hypothetical protein
MLTIIYIISTVLCLLFFTFETWVNRKSISSHREISFALFYFVFSFIPFLNTLYCIISIFEYVVIIIKLLRKK